MINWTVPALAFGLSAVLGAWLDGRFQERDGWTKRRRVLRAALPLPLLVVALSACGIGWELVRPRTGSTMTDLAVAVYLGIGVLFAMLTLAGGLIGASVAEKKVSP